MFSLPRGTKDLYGSELKQITELVFKLKEIAYSFNYQEVQTPVFEHCQVFEHNNDESLSDKELFYLENKKYILRPENTAPIVRFVVSQKLLATEMSPLQFFYCSKCYRHERPQYGRYREFIQFGFEKINCTSIVNDLEIIILVEHILKSLNLKLKLRINFLSSQENKDKWNKELTKYFINFQDKLSEASQKRIYKNPIRILDDKEDIKKSFIQEAPKISMFLSDQENNDIQFIKKQLLNLKIDYFWDDALVRGISYYTGLVYEWEYDDLTIIGGGRYDELFSKFISTKVPSVGLAIGVERLINVLNKNSFKWKEEINNTIHICCLLEEPDLKILNLIIVLREQGFKISCNWDKNSLKNHFNYCSKKEIFYTLIYGENEKKEEKIIFKKQLDNNQFIFSLKDINHLIMELKKQIF